MEFVWGITIFDLSAFWKFTSCVWSFLFLFCRHKMVVNVIFEILEPPTFRCNKTWYTCEVRAMSIKQITQQNVGSLCSILVGCQPLFKVSLVPPGDKKNCQVGARHQENGEAGGKRWKAGDWGCHGGPWSGGRTGGTWAKGNQHYLQILKRWTPRPIWKRVCLFQMVKPPRP